MNEQLLTVEQVAEHLQVHPRTVQAWIRRGDLVGVRLGTGRTSAWRVEPAQLQAYIEKNRSKPMPRRSSDERQRQPLHETHPTPCSYMDAVRWPT